MAQSVDEQAHRNDRFLDKHKRIYLVTPFNGDLVICSILMLDVKWGLLRIFEFLDGRVRQVNSRFVQI